LIGIIEVHKGRYELRFRGIARTENFSKVVAEDENFRRLSGVPRRDLNPLKPPKLKKKKVK
jgi:hypothetical protein